MVLDALAARRNLVFSRGFPADTARFSLGGKPVYLVKPQTFMNLSGDAVLHVLRQAGAEPEDCVVVTDDLALPFGSLRIRARGSSGGHNGLADIEAKLKTSSYGRIRMGIGSDYPRGMQAGYVLSPFSEAEKEKLPAWIDRAVDACLCMAGRGMAAAMNQYSS